MNPKRLNFQILSLLVMVLLLVIQMIAWSDDEPHPTPENRQEISFQQVGMISGE